MFVGSQAAAMNDIHVRFLSISNVVRLPMRFASLLMTTEALKRNIIYQQSYIPLSSDLTYLKSLFPQHAEDSSLAESAEVYLISKKTLRCANAFISTNN